MMVVVTAFRQGANYLGVLDDQPSERPDEPWPPTPIKRSYPTRKLCPASTELAHTGSHNIQGHPGLATTNNC